MVENLREAVESIQELLAGKEVSVRTDSFAIERVKLSKSARGRIPIYIGSTSPKGLRLAGEIVDGAILVERIAGEIKEAMTHIELGLASSSRSRKEFEVVNSVVISITDDKRRAQNAARANCAYLAAWLGEDTSIKYGINEEKRKEIARHINEGDESGAARLVDQRMIDLLTVSGTVEECVEKCREHLSQGIDQIAFCEPFGPSDKAAALSLIAKKVIPKL